MKKFLILSVFMMSTAAFADYPKGVVQPEQNQTQDDQQDSESDDDVIFMDDDDMNEDSDFDSNSDSN